MLLSEKVRKIARRTATPPAMTGCRSAPIPGRSIFFTCFAATICSRSHLRPSHVIAALAPSPSRDAARIEEIARIVPDEPSVCSQPSASSRRFTDRISTCALISAFSNDSSVIFPSSKKRFVQDTQPMSRLASSRISKASPTISSVLPPPMSTTRRRARSPRPPRPGGA